MGKFRTFLTLLRGNRREIAAIVLMRLNHFIPDDKRYLKLLFRFKMGYKLDLRAPKTFNEKLQWLKIYNRCPSYTKMVDKHAVKDYVSTIIGSEYIIPTLGVWDSPDDIDWDKLPEQFVLKTTHGGGNCGVVVCKNKTSFDIKKAIEELNKSLKQDIYKTLREWPYKNVRPRIIAEQYMEDESGFELKDYKFFCFNGQVKCLKVDFNRFIEHHANYYDTQMNLLPFGEINFKPDPCHIIDVPQSFNHMIEIAEKLSKDIPFVRIDLYNINGKIYFGEITFYPASGMGSFTSEEWDLTLGSWIYLP